MSVSVPSTRVDSALVSIPQTRTVFVCCVAVRVVLIDQFLMEHVGLSFAMISLNKVHCTCSHSLSLFQPSCRGTITRKRNIYSIIKESIFLYVIIH